MLNTSTKRNFLPDAASVGQMLGDLRPVELRCKRRPGPPAANAPTQAERDLADAALILELVDTGALRIRHENQPTANSKNKNNPNQQPRLTPDQEADLAKRVQIWGDVDARNRLVMANMGLVHLVANQFCRPPLRYEDLVQEGTMGLIRATETFEPGRSVRFSTYSVYWIRAKIQRLIQKIERDDLPGIVGAEAMIDEDGRKRKPRARKLSIERSLEDEDSRTLGEMLPSDIDDPERIAMRQEKHNIVKSVLNEIVEELGDYRLRAIIEWRLLTDEPRTLAEIGIELNISREGARLLETKMIRLARERLSDWKDK